MLTSRTCKTSTLNKFPRLWDPTSAMSWSMVSVFDDIGESLVVALIADALLQAVNSTKVNLVKNRTWTCNLVWACLTQRKECSTRPVDRLLSLVRLYLSILCGDSLIVVYFS